MSAQDSHYAQVIDPDSPLAGTARIGAELRQIRERIGWKLSEVAAELRIREPFLDAIEQGDLDALPGPAYQVGFVRSYAQALGLDGDEILRRFRAEGGVGTVKKPELSFLAPVPDRAVPSGAIVLLGVVLLLVGYGLWFLHTENDHSLAASIPAVPAQLAPLAVPPAPPKPAPAVAQIPQPAKPAPAIASAAAAGGAASGTAPATSSSASPALSGATMAASGLAPAAPSPAAATGAPQPKPGAATATAPAAAIPAAGKTILATADSWVEVKDANGNILFSRVMHSGDSWPVPDMPGLTMTAGNAGGTEIADNGAAGQPLGAQGAVLRNYALTPGGAAPASATPATPPASPAPASLTPVSPAPAAPASTPAEITPSQVQTPAAGTN